MKRTSYPRSVARSLKVAAMVAFAMVAVIYAAIEQGRGARATRILRMLPSTARAVLQVDPPALRRSAAGRTLLEAFVEDAELSEIEATCGLDPIADLSQATVWARGSDREPFQSFGLMLTGANVDAAQIAECYERLVEARGGSVTRLEAPTGPLLASNDRGSAVALVDGRTVITGSIQTVAEAMAVQRGLLPSLAERGPVAALWPTVGRGAALAAALDPPPHWKAALERITSFGADASALHGVNAMGVSVRPGRSRSAEVYLDSATPELAARSATLIRGWVVSPPEAIEPPWDQLLRTANVVVDGHHVLVRVDVSSLAADR